MDNSVVRCADEIIDICHELKALLSVNGAFDAYKLKLLGRLQRLSLSVGLDDEREDEKQGFIMDDAVIKYRQRRQERLNAKAVERYKMRRDERLLPRFDDDDDAENGSGGKHGGGHGNTKIPFGLCQREGIKVQPNWTPKDAWDALAEKGYLAGEVYAELKKSGKVGEKKSKSLKEQIESIKDNAKKSERGKSYTSEEIHAAGKATMEYLNKTMIEARKPLTEAQEKYDKQMKKLFDMVWTEKYMGEEYALEAEKGEKLEKELKQLRESLPDKKEMLKSAISLVRSVGMGKHKTGEIAVKRSGSEQRVMQDFEDAMNLYPTDWVDAMAKNVEQYGKLSISTAKRGYFMEIDRVVGLSDREGCAIHEIGHFIERAVPEIREAEKAFYEYRTKGERLVPYIPGSSELIRADHFANPYMGKECGGRSFELVSSGFDQVYNNYEDFSKKDTEMCEWILGLMMLV